MELGSQSLIFARNTSKYYVCLARGLFALYIAIYPDNILVNRLVIREVYTVQLWGPSGARSAIANLQETAVTVPSLTRGGCADSLNSEKEEEFLHTEIGFDTAENGRGVASGKPFEV